MSALVKKIYSFGGMIELLEKLPRLRWMRSFRALSWVGLLILPAVLYGYASVFLVMPLKKGLSNGDLTVYLEEYLPSKKITHRAALVDPKAVAEFIACH